MAIKIKTKKIIDRGDRRVEILEIEMLKYSQLPLNYTEIGESVYLCTNNSGYVNVEYYRNFDRYRDESWLRVGKTYSPKTIQKRLEIIHSCGKRLSEINRLLAEENKDWNGEETFTI